MLQKNLVYLDSAATAHKPQQVIDATAQLYAQEYGTVHRSIYATAAIATENYQKSRKKVQRFIGARHDEEIVFCKGTTEAINLVATSFGKAFIKENDEILISEMEHHSNIVPWQIAAHDRSAVLKVIPVLDDGRLDLAAFKQLLSKKTKIVSIAYVSNVLGTVNPVAEILHEVKKVGAYLFLDAAQAVPHISVNVQELDVDFLAFSGHKAVGPTGIGVLYGKKELLEQLPPYQGGGDMIATVTFEKTTYNVPPLRFEAGTPPIAQVAGLGAAVDFLSSIGMHDIAAWEEELLLYALEKMQHIKGLTILGPLPDRGPLITFTVKGVHPLDIATLLDVEAIAIRSGHMCAQPILRRFGLTAAARASFAFYNTKKEIDFFVEQLKKVLQQLEY